MKGKSNNENAWYTISGKECKSIIILSCVAILIWIMAIIAKKILGENGAGYMNMLCIILGCLVFASFLGFGILMYNKKRFLSDSHIEDYTQEIFHNVLITTPTEIITESYIFNRILSGYPIVLAQVEWVYRKRVYAGEAKNDNIILRMRNGKKREMVHRVSLTESDIYHLVAKKNSRVMIGYSGQNKRVYDDIVELYN